MISRCASEAIGIKFVCGSIEGMFHIVLFVGRLELAGVFAANSASGTFVYATGAISTIAATIKAWLTRLQYVL